MNDATRKIYLLLGSWVAFMGAEHNVGEIAQGSVQTEGIFIQSWDKEIYEILAGEPALTIVPNMLLTGILGVLVSLLILFWVWKYNTHQHAILVFFLLCIASLLFGGGFGPPLMGFITSLGTRRMNQPISFLKDKSLGKMLASSWKISIVAFVLAALSLFPGTLIFSAITGGKDGTVVLILTPFMLLSQIWMLLASNAKDARTQ